MIFKRKPRLFVDESLLWCLLDRDDAKRHNATVAFLAEVARLNFTLRASDDILKAVNSLKGGRSGISGYSEARARFSQMWVYDPGPDNDYSPERDREAEDFRIFCIEKSGSTLLFALYLANPEMVVPPRAVWPFLANLDRLLKIVVFPHTQSVYTSPKLKELGRTFFDLMPTHEVQIAWCLRNRIDAYVTWKVSEDLEKRLVDAWAKTTGKRPTMRFVDPLKATKLYFPKRKSGQASDGT